MHGCRISQALYDWLLIVSTYFPAAFFAVTKYAPAAAAALKHSRYLSGY